MVLVLINYKRSLNQCLISNVKLTFISAQELGFLYVLIMNETFKFIICYLDCVHDLSLTY